MDDKKREREKKQEKKRGGKFISERKLKFEDIQIGPLSNQAIKCA
jgi:hypothetical protein